MPVKVTVHATGESMVGKFVVVERGMVGLYSGVTARKHGGYRGCGKKVVFKVTAVTVTADDPSWEVEERLEPQK